MASAARLVVAASAAAAFGCTRGGKGPRAADSRGRLAVAHRNRPGADRPRLWPRRDRSGGDRAVRQGRRRRSAASTISIASLRLDHTAERLAAATTHSLGLSARTVSGLNPRVLVYQDISHKRRPVTYEEVVVAGFTRGEQLVELAALDPATYEYNFYLLRFEQACNRTRCTPEDLLTEKIESGWTDWTLYSERDLEDTPLDCVSCHLPFGPGTHKQLLMRQVFDPGCTGATSGAATSARSAPSSPRTAAPARSSSSPKAWICCARSRAPRAATPACRWPSCTRRRAGSCSSGSSRTPRG